MSKNHLPEIDLKNDSKNINDSYIRANNFNNLINKSSGSKI